MAERRYYVYLMASKSRVIYVGVTAFLMGRVLRHGADEGGAFTAKYRVHRVNSCGESDLGGSGGGDEAAGERRFLTGLSAR